MKKRSEKIGFILGRATYVAIGVFWVYPQSWGPWFILLVLLLEVSELRYERWRDGK